MDMQFLSLWRAGAEATAMLQRAAPGHEARLTASSALILSDVPMAEFNFAILFGDYRAEEQLREFVDVARSRALPLTVMAAEELADRLDSTVQALGLIPVGGLPLMVYRPQEIPSSGGDFQIVQITDEAGVRDANILMASAFGQPIDLINRFRSVRTLAGLGVSAFLAKRDGIPVSTVWTTHGGNNVGIWSMATPPEYQRQGAAQALLTHLFARYREQGADTFYLASTPAGFPLYERLGFRVIGKAALWAMIPASS